MIKYICLLQIVLIPFISDNISSQTISLSFNDCLTRAIENNLSIKVLTYNHEAVKANLQLTMTKRYPRFYLDLNAGIAQFKGGIPINNYLLPFDEYEKNEYLLYGGIGLYSKYNLFDNGRTALKIDEEKITVNLSENFLKQGEQKVLFQTAVLYVNLIHLKEQNELKKEQQKILIKLLSIVHDYVSQGIVPYNKVKGINKQLLLLEDQLLIAKYKYDEYLNELKLVLGISEYQTIEVNSMNKKIMNKICNKISIKKDYELVEIELIEKKNKIRYEQAIKHNKFFVNLETYIKYSKAQSWMIGLGLNWPVWDFGETTAVKSIAYSNYQSSQVDYIIEEKQIRYEQNNAYNQMILAQDRLNLIMSRKDSISLKEQYNINCIDSLHIDEAMLVCSQKVEYYEQEIIKTERMNKYLLSCLNYLNVNNTVEELLNL